MPQKLYHHEHTAQPMRLRHIIPCQAGSVPTEAKSDRPVRFRILELKS